MLRTVRDACTIHPMVHDYRMSEAIENLSDLIQEEGSGEEFFARNYVTQGMDTLFREGLLRLAGKSDQAAFELVQAMGGGKTHLMVALGLLARHPHLRPAVLPPDLAERLDFGAARIAAFNGRNDPEHYIWGEIGRQRSAATPPASTCATTTPSNPARTSGATVLPCWRAATWRTSCGRAGRDPHAVVAAIHCEVLERKPAAETE